MLLPALQGYCSGKELCPVLLTITHRVSVTLALQKATVYLVLEKVMGR